MKRRLLWAAAGVSAYLALLRLLVFLEAADPAASILTMADALWFSLVTLTTAGYGDRYPVTAGGRLVGSLFLLLSTGLLAVLVSAAVLLASGRLIPRLRLWFSRRRPWYIFSQLNRESAAMAGNLAREQPKAVLVFCQGQSAAGKAQPGWLLVNGEPADVLRWRGKSRDCTLLVMGPDSLANYAQARKCAAAGVPVCCQTGVVPLRTPEGIKRFDRWECCARLYWQKHPLGREERTVVLCGFGRYAAALLEQALLVNVFPPEHRVTYHVFGDAASFLRRHSQLAQAVSVNAEAPDRDAVIFHTGPWDGEWELLAGAGRVVLCADDDGENLDMLRCIRRYFPLEGKLHLRLTEPLEGEEVFGADGDLFTPELILRTGLDRAAMEMHEIYRRDAGEQAPAWEELSDFLRRSNLAAADHLLTKVRLLLEDDAVTALTVRELRTAYRRWLETAEERGEVYREVEHRRWARFYLLNNWRCSPVRDNARRLHPDLRPFDRLSPEEQAKDDYAWQLLGALADSLEKQG